MKKKKLKSKFKENSYYLKFIYVGHQEYWVKNYLIRFFTLDYKFNIND